MTLFVGDAALGVPNVPRNFGTPRGVPYDLINLFMNILRIMYQ